MAPAPGAAVHKTSATPLSPAWKTSTSPRFLSTLGGAEIRSVTSPGLKLHLLRADANASSTKTRHCWKTWIPASLRLLPPSLLPPGAMLSPWGCPLHPPPDGTDTRVLCSASPRAPPPTAPPKNRQCLNAHFLAERKTTESPRTWLRGVPASCLGKKRLCFVPGAIHQTPLRKGLKGDLFCRSRFRASA